MNENKDSILLRSAEIGGSDDSSDSEWTKELEVSGRASKFSQREVRNDEGKFEYFQILFVLINHRLLEGDKTEYASLPEIISVRLTSKSEVHNFDNLLGVVVRGKFSKTYGMSARQVQVPNMPVYPLPAIPPPPTPLAIKVVGYLILITLLGGILFYPIKDFFESKDPPGSARGPAWGPAAEPAPAPQEPQDAASASAIPASR
jgi:hypothetical protein